MDTLLRHRAKIVHSNIWKGRPQAEPPVDPDDYDKEMTETQLAKRYARSIDIIVDLLRKNQKYLRDTYAQPHSSPEFLYSYFSTLLNVDDVLMKEFELHAAEFNIPYYTYLKDAHVQFDYLVSVNEMGS